MRRIYPNTSRKTPYKRVGSQGFPDGLNTLGHPVAIKNSELTEVTNTIYSQYGTLSKRPGSYIIGEALAGSTEILSMGKALAIGANRVNYNIRISDVGKPEYYDYDNEEWVLFSGTAPVGYAGSNPAFTAGVPTFDTTVKTNIAQINNIVFFGNSINELIYWDDGAWYIFTTVADPTVAPTLAKTGTGAGSTNWYYKYCDTNATGTTASSPISLALTSMPATLDSTTYITVTLPAAAANATARTIYRGITPDRMMYYDQIEVGTTSYVDKGQKTPSGIFTAPTENSTKGYHFYVMDVYSETLIGTTVEMGKDMIVYSAGGDKPTSFLLGDGAGYIPYRRTQGREITSLKAFAASNEDGVFVFKWDKVGKLKFTSLGTSAAGAVITDVNIAVGSPAPMSPHIAGNNMRFWSEDGASSLGNEANYGTILRYSVMSLKSDYYANQINRVNVAKICAEYYKHLSLFAVPIGDDSLGNNSVLVFDERYNAWAFWTGLNISCLQKFVDNNNVEKLYAGSSNSGNVVELFNGKVDNRSKTSAGSAITMSVTTKQYGDTILEQKNRFNKVVLIFGTLTGNSTTAYVQEDGVYNQSVYKVPSSAQNNVGFGSDIWGTTMFGTSDEETLVIPNINFRYLNLQNKMLRNLKINITNNGISDEVELLGIFIYYKPTNVGPDYSEQITEVAS